jgi:fatty acid desaturase
MNSPTKTAKLYPVPDRLNTALVLFVSSTIVALLWLASWMQSWIATFAVAIVCSYVMLTNYALLHDATHDTLRSGRRANYWLGFLAGVWFPVPFSMIHYTHRTHHRFNRTDAEMFDLYYPTDNLFLKYVQWFSILCGLFWPLVPLGAIVIACTPNRLRTKWFARANPARGLNCLSHMPVADVRRTRLEIVAILAIFTSMVWILDLRLGAIALCYGCFAFNWSTRQYITHAFSPRDVVEGAFNLQQNWLMDRVLLHGQWDLNHHLHPDVSWYHLPTLSDSRMPERSYLSQYFRQWRGPVPATEASPQPLADECLQDGSAESECSRASKD